MGKQSCNRKQTSAAKDRSRWVCSAKPLRWEEDAQDAVWAVESSTHLARVRASDAVEPVRPERVGALPPRVASPVRRAGGAAAGAERLAILVAE